MRIRGKRKLQAHRDQEVRQSWRSHRDRKAETERSEQHTPASSETYNQNHRYQWGPRDADSERERRRVR